MKTLKQFVNESHLPEDLIHAVVKQSDSWDDFKEIAEDVANHGVDAGFSGFIYYTETVKFYTDNREIITKHATEEAEQLGYGSAVKMVKSFNCLNSDYSEDEIGMTLYGSSDDMDSHIANALAWYALEEVSRNYSDLK